MTRKYTRSIEHKKHKQKKKTGKLDFIKFTNFSPKHTLKKMKKDATDWEKIFRIHLSDKRLVCPMIKVTLATQ